MSEKRVREMRERAREGEQRGERFHFIGEWRKKERKIRREDRARRDKGATPKIFCRTPPSQLLQ